MSSIKLLRAAVSLASAALILVAIPDSRAAEGNATQSAAPEASSAVELAEVLVTARRREENLMRVPVAVTVMSDADIANSGVKTLQELSQFTPGMFSQSQNSGGRADRSQVRLTFRGLSTSSGTIFIDGAPYSGNGSPDITDVSRVEVLKGPQSVYFGRATFSGAVNYVTKTPGNEFAGRASADIYSYNGKDARVMVEGPLIRDLVAARLSVRRFTFDGQYKSGVAQHPLGSQSTTFASLTLASSPAPHLNLSAYLSYNLDDDGPPESAGIRAVGPGPTFNCNLGGTGGPYWCGALPKLSQINPLTIGTGAVVDAFTRSELVDNVRGYPVTFSSRWMDHYGLRREVRHAHLKADISTESGWEAALLAAYSRTKYASIGSVENGDVSSIVNTFRPSGAALTAACAAVQPGPLFTNSCFAPVFAQITTRPMSLVNDYSVELRVSSPQNQRLRGTLGASNYRVNGPPATNFGIQNSGRLINGGGGGLKSGVDTPAVFGGIYFDASDRLKLSAEARYQWDGITQQQLFPAVTAQLHKVFKSFSPRITADYSLGERTLLYGTWSRGYRPGGFNAGLLGLSDFALAQLASLGTNISYEQERLDNFELGNKATWFDNRLRTTLALYYMSYTDGLVSNANFFSNPNGSTASVTVISNFGKIDLKGIELEAEFAASRRLNLSGTFAYADNKIVNYIYTPNGPRIRNTDNVTGNQTDQQPRLTFSLSPTYTWQMANGLEWFSRLDYRWQSKVYVDPTNVAWRDARSLVDLRLGASNDKGLRVEAYARNLFNDDTLTEAAKISDGTYGPSTPCPPCYTTAAPPVLSAGVSVLNIIGIGFPVKRTFGIRASFEF